MTSEGPGKENFPAKPQDVLVVRVSDEAINLSWEWRIRGLTMIPKGTHCWAIPFKDEYNDHNVLQKVVKETVAAYDPMYGPRPAFRLINLSKLEEEPVSPIAKGGEYLVCLQSFNDEGVSELCVGKVKFVEEAQWQTL